MLQVIVPGMTKHRLEALELLVDELLKERPETKRIRDKMSEVGLNYTPDPVEQMNSVLRALNETRVLSYATKGRTNEQDLS